MKLLEKFSIGKRLGVGFAAMLAMTVITTTIGVWRLGEVTRATEAMMAEPLRKERLVSDFHTLIFGSVRRTTAIVKSTDPGLAAFFKEETVWSMKQGDVLLGQLVPLLTEGREKAQYALAMEKRAAYNSARDRATKAKAEGRMDESAAIFQNEFVPAARGFQGALQDLVSLQRRQIDDTVKVVTELGKGSGRLMELLTLAATLLGTVCAWMLTRSIVRPIREAVNVAQAVAGGDLTRRIEAHGRDETGALLAALRRMNDSLAGIVGQVRGGTAGIAAASGQINAGNLDLSSRTAQQASALEETAASMEELTMTVRQNADNAQEANALAIAASEAASQGGAVVNEAVAKMGAINQSAKRIADIIGVIDGIAFQTNILALNAAVEAARAGEQGRGFAVVASEVRNLAQRSAAAAREIKGLISASVASVDAGTLLVDQAGATMEQVVTSIARVTSIMAEIARASQEQTCGIEQVNQAIAQMDQVMQRNATLVEEAAATTGSMQDQAASLAQVVSVFRLERSADAVEAVPKGGRHRFAALGNLA
jgi:methyl-accepting chemotaxis protein